MIRCPHILSSLELRLHPRFTLQIKSRNRHPVQEKPFLYQDYTTSLYYIMRNPFYNRMYLIQDTCCCSLKFLLCLYMTSAPPNKQDLHAFKNLEKSFFVSPYQKILELFVYTPLRFVVFANRPCIFILILSVSPKLIVF